MTIPNLDANGNLPPGIHNAQVDEIVTRFGIPGLARRERTASLESFLNVAQRFAVGVYLDGSYITGKRAPGDVDLALVLPEGFDPSSEDGRLIQRYQQAKRRYRLHIFAYVLGEDDLLLASIVEYWQRDRQGNRKGIIYVRFDDD